MLDFVRRRQRAGINWQRRPDCCGEGSPSASRGGEGGVGRQRTLGPMRDGCADRPGRVSGLSAELAIRAPKRSQTRNAAGANRPGEQKFLRGEIFYGRGRRTFRIASFRKASKRDDGGVCARAEPPEGQHGTALPSTGNGGGRSASAPLPGWPAFATRARNGQGWPRRRVARVASRSKTPSRAESRVALNKTESFNIGSYYNLAV